VAFLVAVCRPEPNSGAGRGVRKLMAGSMEKPGTSGPKSHVFGNGAGG